MTADLYLFTAGIVLLAFAILIPLIATLASQSARQPIPIIHVDNEDELNRLQLERRHFRTVVVVAETGECWQWHGTVFTPVNRTPAMERPTT